jgi:hypothetical protein
MKIISNVHYYSKVTKLKQYKLLQPGNKNKSNINYYSKVTKIKAI